MFWNNVSPIYDLFENLYNKKVYVDTGKRVAELITNTDDVLECACGTGAITVYVAPRCKSLIATDYAEGMLKRASQKCAHFNNVTFQKADITHTGFKDASFDKVIAGNIIHLLPEPEKVLAELERVVRPGGKLIIPTYINKSKKSSSVAAHFIKRLGANFQNQFDLNSYKQFFSKLGYEDVEYIVVDGRMSCAIAVISVSL
ncbi:class I SAM-dependent methyltransferase [Atopobium fossor]|uniref:class I SAM-dependent methyltransferase n=1 Tax=Atopobium fossor TaxID=39487 RepID=UPI00041C991A|nr:class I SAM-dependent methyltransferase [Atopobium fossor]